MRRPHSLKLTPLALLLIAAGPALTPAAAQPASPVGIFEDHADIGDNPKPGSIEYDTATGEYRVTGGGANIWAATDAFHFAWKRLSGDFTLSALVHFIGVGKVDHRKAVLMIRQNLNPDSPYADVALHGDGMTSLQFRNEAAAETTETRSGLNTPIHLRIERRGNQFTLYASKQDAEPAATGPVTVVLHDPVYVGIGVCSHDASVLETAIFSKVTIDDASPRQ